MFHKNVFHYSIFNNKKTFDSLESYLFFSSLPGKFTYSYSNNQRIHKLVDRYVYLYTMFKNEKKRHSENKHALTYNMLHANTHIGGMTNPRKSLPL